MSENNESSNAVNNYGINDEGIKSTGPSRAAIIKRIPLLSVVLTLSYRIVDVDGSPQVQVFGSTNASDDAANDANDVLSRGTS